MVRRGPPKSFAKESRRIPQILTRFAGPLLCLVGGGLGIIGHELLDWNFRFERVGAALVVVGILWAVALGFALGTLRLVTGLAVLAIILLLTNVGDSARDRVEATEYLSLRSELGIELNILEGARTTRGDVVASLQLSEASRLNGEDRATAAIRAIALLEADKVESDDAADATIEGYVDELKQLAGMIRGSLKAVDEAVQAGGAALQVEISLDEEGAPAAAEDASETPEAGEAPAEDLSLREPAPAEARVAAATAADVAADLDQWSALIDQILAAQTAAAVPADLVPLSELLAGSGDGLVCPDPDERDLTVTNFARARTRANICVQGCVGADDSVCQPRTAKRLILLAFQQDLELLTEQEDVTDDLNQLVDRLGQIRAQLDGLQEPVAVHVLVMEGADELLGDAMESALNDDTPARLGGWGWLIIAIAIIIGYRLLEIANDRRSPGPVAVVPTGEKPSGDTVLSTDLVRAHLTASDLQEPSPVPGGEAVASITTSAEASGVENQAVRFVISLLQNTAFPKRGLELDVGVQTASPTGSVGADDPDHPTPRVAGEEEADGKTGKYRLLLRAATTRRNGLLFSQPFVHENLDEVSQQAAYFAAEQLLDSGWTTPSWLQWTSRDGTALRAYQKVMLHDRDPGKEEIDRCALLQEAVVASPGTGAALVALSHELSLEGNYAAATHQLLLARVRHPRFVTARYRLGVTLSMLASDVAQYWDYPDDADTKGAVDVLDDLYAEWKTPATSDREWAIRLLSVAIDELQYVIDSSRGWTATRRAYRQEERRYWLGLAKSSRRRRALRASAMSAQALAVRRHYRLTVTRSDADTRRFLRSNQQNDKAVRLASDDWIVRYNAACYCTDRARFDEAVDHLRRARFARNGQQLSRDWVDVDPDLTRLRARYGKAAWDELLDEIF